MDADIVALCDDEMLLRWARSNHHDVARQNCTLYVIKPRDFSEPEPIFRGDVAQSVPFRRGHFVPDRNKAGVNQADAIEASRRITPVQAKGHTHKTRSSVG